VKYLHMQIQSLYKYIPKKVPRAEN
jgi:hypothetical protein